jgi:hypothetical protein
MLLEQRNFGQKIDRLFDDPRQSEALRQSLIEIEHRIERYIWVKSAGQPRHRGALLDGAGPRRRQLSELVGARHLPLQLRAQYRLAVRRDPARPLDPAAVQRLGHLLQRHH